ncbi:hypothetical protein BV25DRAFT_1920102 [Artomyces pyxidatus]|uniref:Uncharacterized protein n=1 Tax=Artomyces pyxidatus TaxID=48021 RepID=A0ACB8SML3_9AGAM|nr:hypothetical protein BV25DRAFT_1920102 [Artomyces pyxidatus]
MPDKLKEPPAVDEASSSPGRMDSICCEVHGCSPSDRTEEHIRKDRIAKLLSSNPALLSTILNEGKSLLLKKVKGITLTQHHLRNELVSASTHATESIERQSQQGLVVESFAGGANVDTLPSPRPILLLPTALERSRALDAQVLKLNLECSVLRESLKYAGVPDPERIHIDGGLRWVEGRLKRLEQAVEVYKAVDEVRQDWERDQRAVSHRGLSKAHSHYLFIFAFIAALVSYYAVFIFVSK